MAYNRTQLKDRVAQRIDEVLPSGIAEIQSIVEGNYDLIDDELDESTEFILRQAPIELIYPAASNDTGATLAINNTSASAEYLVATITCPTDFIRFVSCQTSGMSRPINGLYPNYGAKFNQIQNKYSGGTYERPMGVLIPGTAGSKYKVKIWRTQASDDTLSEFLYIPTTVAESAPASLQDVIIYDTAGRVLNSMRQFDAANQAFALSKQILESTKTGLIGEG